MSKQLKASECKKVQRPAPSADEQRTLDGARAEVRRRAPRLTVRCEQAGSNQIIDLGAEHSDHDGWLARLDAAFGSRGRNFAISQLNWLIRCAQDKDGKVDGIRLNGMVAMIEGAAPQNEMQAALAVQMALIHATSQMLLVRAQRADQIPQFDSASNSAVKLLRTFALHAEALAKLQRGGEQVVKVVHVHPGGQAIVGNVMAGQAGAATGGGDSFENFDQPHAKGESPAPSAALVPEVWRADEARDVVPLAGRQR